MGEVATIEPRVPALPAQRGVLTAADIREHVNRVQEVMQAVMKPDVHYGKIPGTPKPTLYKQGAEVLSVTFRIAPSYKTDDLSTEDSVRYRVTCIGTHQVSGQVLGEGVGECSSNEEKYKWRKPVCTAEFDDAPANRKRVKYTRDGKLQQVRTEPADVANTILKMAAKRAYVAMILSVTGASDIFAQDIEDLPEHLRDEEPVDNTAVTPEQAQELDEQVAASGSDKARFLAYLNENYKLQLQRLGDLPARLLPDAKKILANAAAARAKAKAQP